MLLQGLRVVLVGTRFPENVGMAARACANMGCGELTLVAPERWIPERAAPLATPKGMDVLGGVKVEGDLLSAVGDCHCTVATTARTGGWRRAILSPAQAASRVAGVLADGGRAALVFGREDRGLENPEIELCGHVATIPTFGASSLNLAQAVLLMLYECAGQMRAGRGVARGAGSDGPRISAADSERLMERMKSALQRLDALHGDNPDYFLMPWRRLFARADLRRHEYDAFMGLCRQILSRVPPKAGEKGGRDAETEEGQR